MCSACLGGRKRTGPDDLLADLRRALERRTLDDLLLEVELLVELPANLLADGLNEESNRYR